MSDWDWSTWMSAKAIAHALVESRDQSPTALRELLRSDKTILDGFKGVVSASGHGTSNCASRYSLSYGTGSPEWRPFEGFLHQQDMLDTLGFDQPESACKGLVK